MTSLSGHMRHLYLSNHKMVRPLLGFSSIRLLNILHVDFPFVLSIGDGKAGQSMQPVTLYLTITVSPNLASPILRSNPPKIPTEGYDSPAEETTKASMTPDSGGPIRSTVTEPLLPRSRHLPVKTTTTPHGQAEMSFTEDPLITLRRADEAMKLIGRLNTWERAVRRIKWVMDTLGPIAEVRVMSFNYPSLSRLSLSAIPVCKDGM